MGNKQIILWQKGLNDKGFSPGPADGDFGPKTLSASMDALLEAGIKDNDTGVTALDRPTPANVDHSSVIPLVTNPFQIPHMTRNVDEIIWHCAATREGVSIGKDPIAVITRWHRRRKFRTIGYHAFVDLKGKIWLGRDWDQIGAHVSGHNRGTLGFSYEGGVENTSVMKPKDTRNEAQIASMLWLTQAVTEKFSNIRRISGHNQYAAKACPSFDVREDVLGNIPGFKKGIKHG